MRENRWRVEGPHGHLWVFMLGWRPTDALPPGERLNAEAAALAVDGWFPEGWEEAEHSRTLLSMAAALGENNTPWNADDAVRRSARAVVRRALRDGRFIALRPRLPAPAGGPAREANEAKEPDVPAPRAEREREVWNPRWSRPRVRVGATVQAMFTVRNFAGGEAATVKVYECDGAADGKMTLVDTVKAKVDRTDGDVRVDWSRDEASTEADLAEDQADGDDTPLEYRFEVEAGGLCANDRSGPLWLTNTVVVAMRYRDGGVAVEDGVEISLSSADGRTMTAKTADGEARFEDVVIGPIHIGRDFT